MSTLIWNTWSSDWLLGEKVDFDGINRVIYVHPEVTTLDIRSDIYSAWVDWAALRDHLKFLPAIRVTGLDPIGVGVYTGDIYFLMNNWKLSVNLSAVKITGALYSDDYDTAYYTPSLVAQYPATVAALVNTVASGSGGGSALDTAIAVRNELAVELARMDAAISSRSSLTAQQVWEATVRELTAAAGLTSEQAAMLIDIASKTTAIKLKTDSLTFTSAGRVDSNVKAVNNATVAGTGATLDPWRPQ